MSGSRGKVLRGGTRMRWPATLLAISAVALGFGTSTWAQVETAPPPPREAAAEPPPVSNLIPIDISVGKIYINVKVNGKGPFCFALDTGAPPTVIDLDLAKELVLQ